MGELSATAIVDVATLRDYIGAKGVRADGLLANAINQATGWLEAEACRHFVTRGNVTELHTLHDCRTLIRLSEWPTIAVVSVHESTSWPRVYDAGSLLVENTGYALSKARGVVHRLSSGGLGTWASGFRAVQVVHSYGYRKTDGTPTEALPVPEDVRLLALFVAASIFKEADRGRWGVSSVTDGAGTVTRFLGYLPGDMRDRLEALRRRELDPPTWEIVA